MHASEVQSTARPTKSMSMSLNQQEQRNYPVISSNTFSTYQWNHGYSNMEWIDMNYSRNQNQGRISSEKSSEQIHHNGRIK